MSPAAQQWLLKASPEAPCRLPAFQVRFPCILTSTLKLLNISISHDSVYPHLGTLTPALARKKDVSGSVNRHMKCRLFCGETSMPEIPNLKNLTAFMMFTSDTA